MRTSLVKNSLVPSQKGPPNLMYEVQSEGSMESESLGSDDQFERDPIQQLGEQDIGINFYPSDKKDGEDLILDQ